MDVINIKRLQCCRVVFVDYFSVHSTVISEYGFRRNGRNLFEEVPENFLMEHEKN